LVKNALFLTSNYAQCALCRAISTATYLAVAFKKKADKAEDSANSDNDYSNDDQDAGKKNVEVAAVRLPTCDVDSACDYKQKLTPIPELKIILRFS